MTPQQMKELYESLLEAFPNRGSLQRLVAFGLNHNLNQISQSDSLSTDVFKLIKDMKARGQERALVVAAYHVNSDAPRLRAFAESYLGALPPGRPSLNRLYEALLRAFPTRADLERMTLFGLGADLNRISAGQGLEDDVFGLMQWAEARGWTPKLILVAREANPDSPDLRAVAQVYEPQPESPFDQTDVRRERMQFQALGFTNPETALQSQRDYLNAICRIETGAEMGTGVLIADELVLTSFHVIANVRGATPAATIDPENVLLRFDYRRTAAVAPVPEVTGGLAGEWLVVGNGNDRLDYAVLRLDAAPGPSGVVRTPVVPRVYDWSLNEAVLILQHPAGDVLRQAWGSVVRSVPEPGWDGWLDYRVNTQSGSSGAPVFNSLMQLAAIHQEGSSGANRGVGFRPILADWRHQSEAEPERIPPPVGR